MKRLLPRPPKVEHEFTDVCLTGLGGLSALARTTAGLGLFGELSEGVSVKVRRRGVSDCEALWALVAHEVAARGYVPVFVDGTEIEVGGELFEGAGRPTALPRPNQPKLANRTA